MKVAGQNEDFQRNCFHLAARNKDSCDDQIWSLQGHTHLSFPQFSPADNPVESFKLEHFSLVSYSPTASTWWHALNFIKACLWWPDLITLTFKAVHSLSLPQFRLADGPLDGFKLENFSLVRYSPTASTCQHAVKIHLWWFIYFVWKKLWLCAAVECGWMHMNGGGGGGREHERSRKE